MQCKFPRLYSLSTVCLLKHYNQDYLLHSLRTDFTGSNGVGKSIIADLFQIVFIGDAAHVEFATEGIDAKERKIEKLPYDSSVGYAFFHVELEAGKFITMGAAIFSRTNHRITPFLITASTDLENSNKDAFTFQADKLLFSRHFLRADKQPMALDEMSASFPEQHGLYVHHYSTKEARGEYYEWLYTNGIFPVRLSSEVNLKAYAKVIQSFSKSKPKVIKNSKELVEYLFEEDEAEISGTYAQQENTIRRLLQEFKIARHQTDILENKQKDLALLKKQKEDMQKKVLQLRHYIYIDAWQKMTAAKDRIDKAEAKVLDKEKEGEKLKQKDLQAKRLLPQAEKALKEAENKFNTFSNSQALFEEFEALEKQEKVLRSIDLTGLMRQATDHIELLDKNADFYQTSIEESRHVLSRYHTVQHMAKQKKKQDDWLEEKKHEIRDAMKSIKNFQDSLARVENNDIFTHSFAVRKKLNKPEQAVLFHLRNVLLNKPGKPESGTRYTEAVDLLGDLNITEDIANNGWWIQTGPLFEFVTASSIQLPDFQKHEFNSLEEVKEYLNQQMGVLEQKKQTYDNLTNGIIDEEFNEYVFDIDLSDATKLQTHTQAAWLCNMIDYKLEKLVEKKEIASSKIKRTKEELEIPQDSLAYDILFTQIKDRRDVCQKRFNSLITCVSELKSKLNSIIDVLPELKNAQRYEGENYEKALKHFTDCKERFVSRYPDHPLPATDTESSEMPDLNDLQDTSDSATRNYEVIYASLAERYDETKDRVNVLVNEQINNGGYSFNILEKALLGTRIGTLDHVTGHLQELNVQLLTIAEELLKSITKVFAKTETYYDTYKRYIDALNAFFHDRLISNRFYFKINFESNPALDIKWIEHLRKRFDQIAAAQIHEDLDPSRFIEEFFMTYTKSKKTVPLQDLLNPKRYFILNVMLTDENNKKIPGSTGESYTAIALLGIARLSIVQDGERPGLRFIILEESATLDNVNFSMFPAIAKEYGYQIITMTPKPYSIGGEEGWYIHQLLPGKNNKDINYPKVMSYFRTTKEQIQLDNYLNGKRNELADF